MAHTIRFRLKTAYWQERELEIRFRMVWHMHNELVSFAQHRLNELYRDADYRMTLPEYGACSAKLARMASRGAQDSREYKALSARKKQLAGVLSERTKHFSLTKTDFEKYVSVMQHRVKDRISSQQAQKEADRVYAGVEKVLYGNGKHLRFKKLADQHSISQKCAANGVKFDLHSGTVSWCGLSIRADISFNDPYVQGSMSHKILYSEISRLIFDNGWHWYVTVYLDGEAPRKFVPQSGTSGIDLGVSTAAIVSETSVQLCELSPDSKRYNKAIGRQQALVDRQMRQANPDKYNNDGTAKRRTKRSPWVITAGCRRRKRRISVLFRKKAAAMLDSHNRQINSIIARCGPFMIAETMDFAALRKRSKTTHRSEKASLVKTKDGTRMVHKYTKKKRFGRSTSDRAPGKFLLQMQQKCREYGGGVFLVDTKKFRASQYHHDTGEYIKTQLSDRWKTIDGHKVQRDLYSAFLLLCSGKEGTAPDRDKCSALFSHFVTMQDTFIHQTKGETHPACFGY